MGVVSDRVDELTKTATSSATTDVAARAMADTLTDVVRGYVSGDIAGRPITIVPEGREGVATVRTGGGYSLADTGRRRVVAAHALRHSALATPWGPRDSVKGSTWAGFGITERASRDVFDAGTQAVVAAVSA